MQVVNTWVLQKKSGIFFFECFQGALIFRLDVFIQVSEYYGKGVFYSFYRMFLKLLNQKFVLYYFI